MNKEEIINALVEKFELEEVEEIVNDIKTNLVDAEENVDDSNYKEKYEKLKEKYLKRFNDVETKEETKEENIYDEEETKINYEDLVE